MKTPDIRCHYGDGIAEVNSPALAVCKPSVVKELEQYIEDFGMRLLNLIKEYH